LYKVHKILIAYYINVIAVEVSGDSVSWCCWQWMWSAGVLQRQRLLLPERHLQAWWNELQHQWSEIEYVWFKH